MKVCGKCRSEKDLSQFSKHAKSKGGLRSYCKECANSYQKAYYNVPENKRRQLAYEKERRKLPEVAEQQTKAKRNWEAKPENKAKIAAKRKVWRQIPDVKDRHREYRNQYQNKRYFEDPGFALRKRMTASVRKSLRRADVSKSGVMWQTILGYSVAELKKHIESQFLRGMSWGNMSRWHIDHIIPVSSFTYASMEDPEFKACWALTNLRPLWSEDNMKKTNKVLHLV